MKLKTIKEGDIKLKVPVNEELTKKMSVFYNPEMKFDRDISELIISILKPKKICDCLAASGARGLRYKSVLKDSEVVLNDQNPKTAEVMKKNAELNNLEVRIENKDANKLLFENLFDFIDLDPFGSPIYFLDSAAKSIRNKGIVALTATDTAPLCGTSPLTCLRRYGIRSLKTDFYKELGLRIFISSAMKIFSRYDMAFTPIFSYCRRHYFRIFGRVTRGCKRADLLLEQFDYISYCQKCGFHKTGLIDKCDNCGNKLNLIGKIFTGNFASPEFCVKLEKESSKKFDYLSDFINQIRAEQDYFMYYDIHKICKWNGKQIKKKKFLLENLEGSKTHFLDTGIRTNKEFSEILKVFD
ncbi:MAG: hypothetical protein DRP06_02745 [Candidatus Aenigmatarchaeota archaeon]|nr:MAG: hypothetical protein DRP06_02745 [Candidatus Aenigmarchaeota archaeon]